MWGQRFILLAASLLFTKDHGVSGQYATVVECLPPTTTIARPIVQSGGQYILPAIIQPIIPGFDSFSPDPTPCYPNYGNAPAPYPNYPPIIVKESDDFLRNLLYFLIFSMGNKKDSYASPSYCGCSSCSGKCQCSCDCPNCNKNNAKDTSSGTSSSAPIYIPVPIAIPVYTAPDGCRYIDGFCDDILIQDSCDSCCGKDNEINLIIRADY